MLAPGLTSNCRVFEGLIANDLAHGAQVLAFDLRGRGETDRPDSGYRLSDHAADVIATVDILGIDRFVMGGHSFGALLSLWMAANYPDRIAGCVALDPPERIDDEIRRQIKPAIDRLSLVVPSFEEYLVVARAMPYYEGWWDPLFERYFEADLEDVEDGVRPRPRPEHIEQVLDGCVDIDWDATVRAVGQPTLLVRATLPYGPEGSAALLPPEEAARIMSRLSEASMVEVEANHMTMLFGDAAPLTSAAIREFIRGL